MACDVVDEDDCGSGVPTTRGLSKHEHDALLLDAFKHEALRRRPPIIWLPADDLGIAEDEIKNMPEHVYGSTRGATLNAKGNAQYASGFSPPDYVRSDDILL